MLSPEDRQMVLLSLATIMTALSATAPQARPVSAAPPAALLTPHEAAKQFGVSHRWLLAHADEIPGMRRLSRKTIRFNGAALRRHLNGSRA